MEAIVLSGRANDLSKMPPFGRLTARKPVRRNRQGIHWRCKCTCGNYVTVSASNLVSKWTKSCGCLKSERTAESNRLRKRLDDETALKRDLFRRTRQAAKQRGLKWKLTFDEYTELTGKDCHYCGVEPRHKHKMPNRPYLRYNGLDRQDNSIGYTLENVVACCRTCNVAKNNMTFKQWRRWVRRLSQHYKETKWC